MNYKQFLPFTLIVAFACAWVSPAAFSQVAPPPLTDVKNNNPVNPVANPATKPAAEPATSDKPAEKPPKLTGQPVITATTGKNFYDDPLVAAKTENSVFAEVIQSTSFKPLTAEDARKAFASKYLTDRINFLIDTARQLAPGKVNVSLTDADRQKIDAFAASVANGTYKIQDLNAPTGFQGKLQPLLEHLNVAVNNLPAGLTDDQAILSLSEEAQKWLVEQKFAKPGEIGSADQALLNDLARMVFLAHKSPVVTPAHPTVTTTPSVVQPTGNRVTQHQPALTDFLKTLPTTLMNRGDVQSHGHLRNQMVDIALRALQQQFLGGQALNDEERDHVIQLVDKAIKPFENLVGRILHPHQLQYPITQMQPLPVQPITNQLATQPGMIQPTMISPYTGFMPYGGLNCPFFGGYSGLRSAMPASGFGFYIGR